MEPNVVSAPVPGDLPDNWIPEDSFAMRLRAVRYRMGLRVEEMADLCGVPPATWSSWELGQRPRRMDEKVAQIAQATKVDRNWLMWGGGQN